MGNPAQNGITKLFMETVSAVTATNSVALGTRRNTNGADWVYVYNGSSNEFIDIGRGAILASGSTGYTVDVAVPTIATTSAGILVGVCVNNTLTTGTYGWLMTRGFANVTAHATNSAPAKGEAIFLNTSGTFSIATALTDTQAQAWMCGQSCGDPDTAATASFTAYIYSPVF